MGGLDRGGIEDGVMELVLADEVNTSSSDISLLFYIFIGGDYEMGKLYYTQSR